MEITRQKIVRAIREPSYLLEVGERRVQNARAWWFRHTHHANPPEFITLILTTRCNLRCRMCGQYGESGASYDLPRLDLPKDIAFRAIDELAPHGTKFSLSGGEPTLHKDWIEIVQRIKGHGLECDVISNGTLLERNAEPLVDTGIDTVNVSIDGFQETHDRIRGVAGTYDQAIRGLDKILALRTEKGKERPRTVLFYTVTRHNFGGLVDFAEWAQDKGVDAVHFFHLRFFTKRDYEENAQALQKYCGGGGGSQQGFTFDPGHIDTELLIEQIRTLRSREWSIGVKVLPNHPLEELDAYYHDEHYRRKALRNCSVPWITASIAPDGQVMPCMDYHCGDLHQQSFMEIWNGARMKKFRRALRKVERFPVCHRCCM